MQSPLSVLTHHAPFTIRYHSHKRSKHFRTTTTLKGSHPELACLASYSICNPDKPRKCGYTVEQNEHNAQCGGALSPEALLYLSQLNFTPHPLHTLRESATSFFLFVFSYAVNGCSLAPVSCA